MTLTVRLTLLGLVLFGAAYAQIEFAGYITSSHEPLFVLRSPTDGRTSPWLRMGGSFMGYTILAHDPQIEILTVKQNGLTTDLPLKIAQANSDNFVRQRQEFKAELQRRHMSLRDYRRELEQRKRDGMER